MRQNAYTRFIKYARVIGYRVDTYDPSKPIEQRVYEPLRRGTSGMRAFEFRLGGQPNSEGAEGRFVLALLKTSADGNKSVETVAYDVSSDGGQEHLRRMQVERIKA